METKACTKCGKKKTISQFHRNRAKPDGMASTCRHCKQQQQADWYYRNAREHKAKVRANTIRNTISKAKMVYEYLSNHPCADCGETDPVVLQFDHVRGQKVAPVCTLVYLNVSWDRLKAEIAKCEIRCANCHHRKTARDRGYYRFLDR